MPLIKDRKHDKIYNSADNSFES